MSYSVRQNQAYAGNFTAGRGGQSVNKIVLHHAATTDFDGIGRTFQKVGRAASAHYGVAPGRVDQYVPEGSTAWHAGTGNPATNPNPTSIGIEHVNLAGAPNWEVADGTIDTSVELIRDIAQRHGLLPLVVGKTLFQHKDFAPTYCAGRVGDRLQEIADRVNQGIVVPVTGKKSNDEVATEVLAGAWGNGADRARNLAAAGYDASAIQGIVNARLGAGPAPAPAKTPVDEIANQVIAGAWGNGPDRKTNLERAGYNYQEVQNAVNSKLGMGASAPAPARRSDEDIANEIIQRGGWGTGADRTNRLNAAGYNAANVQSIINRKLS